MRFERLHIPAFGPFTDLDLRFPAHANDLHVIFGENEAGKSSLLRAIRDLLFGIHSQSTDNFLHDYKNLRIGGEIGNRAGERIAFQRRKGNKNTLLDAAGAQLPDTALTPFIGSVDLAYFSTMFGLGGRELREGAQQLLSGEGEIGNALFSASLGGTPIQKVLAALTEEAERLFKGRATTNVSIRPAVSRYKELVRQSKEAIVNPETWEIIERDLAASEHSRKTLENEIAELGRQLEWISRCDDALPAVGRLSEQTRQLSELPPLPDVSSDFVGRARAARTQVAEAQAEVRRLTAQIAGLEKRLAECVTSPAILAEAAAVDRLHQDLGSYRDRKKSLSERETKLAGIEPALRAGMENLELKGELESIETLRLSSPARLACAEAAKALEESLERQEKSVTKEEDLKRQIETREKQLESLPEADLNPLRDALASAAGATEADRTLEVAQSEVKGLTREATVRHGRLPGAPKDIDATANLAVPSKATIRRIRDEMEGIHREIKAEQAKILEGKKRIENIQAELGRMARRGKLPSEEALRDARLHRDHGWTLVLAEWKGDGAKEEFISGVPLENGFPQSVVKADEIADDLQKQAEAVAQAEEKRFQSSKSETQNTEAATKIAELQSALTACQASWEEAWKPSGVTPRTPDEMEEWRESWSEFREVLGKLRTAEEALQQKQQRVQQATQQLAGVLGECDPKGFSLLFEAARKRVQAGEKAMGRREEVANQVHELKRQLETVDQDRAHVAQSVKKATNDWITQCKAVGLRDGISPQSGLALLQERKELLSNFDSWQELSAETKALSQQVREYGADVGGKATALGIQGDTTEAQEAGLWKTLVAARDAQSRHDQLAEQVNTANDELEDRKQVAVQASQALDELVHLAKLSAAEELEPLLANLESRNQALAQIATLRDTLSRLARGPSVDEFLSKVRAEDADAFPQRKTQLENEKQEKQTVLQGVRDTLSELTKQKQGLEKAGDAAADYRQQAESCAAALQEDAARFLRLKLATHFLQTQIERFRKENQGPLLEKSGRVFQKITRGAFSGLDAEFNASDVPVLVGLRPDRTSVSIGGMSEGTRDQLYLALRLAALDQYLDAHEPMPLILDDLLITFDDERARAILPQLAGLAKRTQVFLFTHHEHLVELCRQTLGEDQFRLHRLEAGIPSPHDEAV